MTQAAAVKGTPQSRAVRKAASRADKLIEDQRRRAAGEPPVEPPPAPVPENAGEPVGEPTPPPVAPEAAAPQLEPAAPPAPNAPAGAEQTVEHWMERAHYWESRFRSSEGAFKADQAKKLGTIEGQAERIRELEQQLEAAPAPAATIDVSKLKLDDYFTAEQISEFGADALRSLFGGVVKVVAAQVGAAVKPVEARVRSLSEGERQKRYKEFVAAVGHPTTGVPNWESVNKDPRWLAWLAEKDDATGLERQALLDDAHAKLDAPRVIAIFKRFLSLQPGGGQQPRRDPAERVIPKGGPSGGPAGGNPPAAELPVTRADIKAHFSKKAKDKVWAKSDECKAAESRIEAAVAANQVA